ncbi:MAG TPA: helix-turn-helix domain-containing protein [Candidatus Acidoferrum sp.]|nr:helix-turn-helix domain-containing protein [Candidatus Acidoferrum sp.]
MPEAADRGKVLRGGEFYSPVKSRLITDGILLSELRQPCSRSVPRHEHELAYVTVVLQGDYLEGDRGHLDELHPFTAAFNPVGAAHATEIGPAGAWFFTIEFRREAMRAIDLRVPDSPACDRGLGSLLWPSIRLYSAFKEQPANPLLLDSVLVEMMGAVSELDASPAASSEWSVPRWFSRIKERLHEGFREPLRIGDLAREAGIHPVHVARVFRRLEGRTPGEYQQRLQVRAACDLLRDPDWTLAAIAAECGFADQSHFTRAFRRLARTTPARFRQAVLSPGTAA